MSRVGAIELPAIKLVDQEGNNWTALRRNEPLVSKQILLPQLMAGGHDVELINLKERDDEVDYGQVTWRDKQLTKISVGRWDHLDAKSKDVWAITINYIQERDIAFHIIRDLSAKGGRVIVGGSDAFADPQPYLEAGAAAIVMDKSGAANLAIVDHVAGNEPREPLTGVLLEDQTYFKPRIPPMSPEDWPVPSDDVVRQTMGTAYWETSLPDELAPIGSVMADIGCDRHCDFCETPLYRLGYRRMSPETATRWFEAQKKAGSRSVICPSDQFLGRVLWKQGRDEVLHIMDNVRKLGVAILWGNGLELKKMTVGRGMPNSDMTPDLELIQAIWGWDGENGCYQGYLPAERPTFGREAYEKLLPWQEHCELVKAIVKTGVPDITYGVIVGLPDDSHESLANLEVAICDMRDMVKQINPDLIFTITPYAIRPLPGTPQSKALRKSGLLRFEDPAIIGGFWTACADTHHLSYEEVSDWQIRLAAVGDGELMKWQNISGASVAASVER